MMNKSSEFVQRARDAPPEQQFFTDVEIDTMDKLIVDTQVWHFNVFPEYFKMLIFKYRLYLASLVSIGRTHADMIVQL